MTRVATGALLTCLVLAGCEARTAATQSEAACRIIESARALPDEIRETSGLALASEESVALWTHNDGGNVPFLYGVDAAGRLVARVAVESNDLVDWEDLERAPCAAASCVYIADIGDNGGDRATIAIHELPEPAPGARRVGIRRTIRLRYPDRPQDAESLIVLPGPTMYIITKGEHGPVALYRVPADTTPAGVATLEHVRQLGPQPRDAGGLVTAATTSPDGRFVAVRTYHTLFLYRAEDLLQGGPRREVDLRPLGERQGEGVALADDGTVWLSSEGGRRYSPALGRLACTLPADAGTGRDSGSATRPTSR